MKLQEPGQGSAQGHEPVAKPVRSALVLGDPGQSQESVATWPSAHEEVPLGHVQEQSGPMGGPIDTGTTSARIGHAALDYAQDGRASVKVRTFDRLASSRKSTWPGKK